MSEKKEIKPKAKSESDDEKFLDSLITAKKTQSTIHGVNLRAPTLATLAILTRCENALVTGMNLTEAEVMMHVLVFMYVHSAPIDEVHGACIISPLAGKNLALERKGLELGETLSYKSPQDFISLYEDLLEWLGTHMDLRVEAIPSKDATPSSPNV